MEVLAPTLAAIQRARNRALAEGRKLMVVLIPALSGPTVFDEQVREILRQQETSLLDLTEAGFDKTHYFDGDGHWNRRGHAKAAVRIAQFVLEAAPQADNVFTDFDQRKRVKKPLQTTSKRAGPSG